MNIEFKLRETDSENVKYSVREVNEEKYNRLHKSTHTFSYFACTCSDSNREYWRQQVHEYMPDHNPEIHADLTSQMCAELSWDYDADVNIGADQWFIVSATCTIHNTEYTEYNEIIVNMQCDEVQIGLVAILQLLKKAITWED